MEEAGWGCSGERPCLLKPGRVWYVYVGRQGMMVDPWAAIADVSVGKQACHLISRLAPPRLRARILGCVDHDGVHAKWRVGSGASPAADGQMGCHDWSLDGLRVTVVEPQNALLVTSAARVDPRQFPYLGSRARRYYSEVCDFSFHVSRRTGL